MRILVVDSNVTFARKVSDFLSSKLSHADVDIASNVYIVRRRIRENTYDLIIADVVTTLDSDSIVEALGKSQAPKLVWSMLTSGLKQTIFNAVTCNKPCQKPCTEKDFDQMLSAVMSAVPAKVGI